MNEQEHGDLLKYLCEFAQIHQKMALSVHLEETYPGELAESSAAVKRLHEETRTYEKEADRLAGEILRLFLKRDPKEEDVQKANNWCF